ncbi:hypothetical protein BKA66DRAFT_57178 [Pyrenochaeta sp. MPI-SDFR-AT-0127]|nr:hypothetical protein BKA66DRAFT_57178 [Pyrenochaeta sp. MPI-SDFR-AT-0127]
MSVRSFLDLSLIWAARYPGVTVPAPATQEPTIASLLLLPSFENVSSGKHQKILLNRYIANMAANYRPGSRLEHDRNGTYQQVEDWQSNQDGAMPYEESMPVPNYIEVHGGIFPSHPRQDSSQVLPTASPALGFQVNRPRASEERPFVQSTPHQQVSLWDGTHGVVEAINPSSTYYAQNNDQILASHDVIQAPSEQTSLETFGQTYSSQEYYAHDRQCFADNCQNPLSGAVPYYTSSSVDSTSCRVVEDSYGTEESQDMHASSSNTLEWCVSTDPFSADHAYEPFRNSTLEFQEEGPWSTVNTRLERRVPYCTAERTSFVHQTGASDISSSRDGGYDNVSSASVNCLGTSVTTNFEPENMRTSLATVGQVAPIVESHHRSSELCNIAHALGRRTMVMPTSDLFDPGVGFQVPSTPRLEPDRSLRGDPSSL